MSSATEVEIDALFITTKYMVPLGHTLIEIKWPQGQSPIQTDKSTAVGVTNNTIICKSTKSMDMRFHSLCFCMVQGQFILYWAPGTEDLGDYNTKYHPPLYYLDHRPTHAG